MLGGGPGKIYRPWQPICNPGPAMLIDPSLYPVHSILLLQGSSLLGVN